jgi:ABC-2 type transport system permease protein
VSGPSPRIQLAAVFRKEVRQTVRDRRIMFLLVVAPVIQTVVLGFAVDYDVDRVPTVVVDRDGSAESRLHARRLLADGTLLRSGSAPSAREAEAAIDAGEAVAAVILPERLGADLAAGRPAEVQVILDGTDPNRTTVASGAASRYFGRSARRSRAIDSPTAGRRPRRRSRSCRASPTTPASRRRRTSSRASRRCSSSSSRRSPRRWGSRASARWARSSRCS